MGQLQNTFIAIEPTFIGQEQTSCIVIEPATGIATHGSGTHVLKEWTSGSRAVILNMAFWFRAVILNVGSLVHKDSRKEGLYKDSRKMLVGL